MHKINDICENPNFYIDNFKKRGLDLSKEINKLIEINKKRKKIIVEIEKLKEEKNISSNKISSLIKSNKSKEIDEIKIDIVSYNEKISKGDLELKNIEIDINEIISYFPNIINETTPVGKDENDNLEIRRWENQRYKPNNYDHSNLGIQLGIFDSKKGVKLSGSRFVIYTNKGSKLLRSVVDFLLNINAKNGYKEQWLPLLVNRNIMFGTAQLPKMENDAYKTNEDMFLLPTAEVGLTNLYKDDEIKMEDLPIKLTAFTQCFRKESGSAGKDTKGIIRMHQFNKVELVKLTKPGESFNELELMVNNVEEILKLFDLPYRVLSLCSGDIGFSSTKTYDLEVWMPSQNKFREISSCSNCLDFQSKRINLKYRDENKKLNYLHTLNGSCLAVDRLIAAIIENYYDGEKLVLPNVLRKYFDNDEFF